MVKHLLKTIADVQQHALNKRDCSSKKNILKHV